MIEALAVAILSLMLIAIFYAAGWMEGREHERRKLRSQLAALRASLRLADAAWNARQDLRAAAIDETRRASTDTA